jgi:hypothetical protein
LIQALALLIFAHRDMKTRLSTVLAFIALVMMAFAFDPDGPPPEKTMEWTSQSLSRTIIPSVSIHDATVEEAAHFISVLEVPDAYKPMIDCSKIADKTQRVTFSGRNLTRLEAIGMLAQAIDSDILISPGTVILVPRIGGGKQAADEKPEE